MQEIVEPINNRPIKNKKIDWIKWLIWVPWVSLIVFMVIKAGGYQQVNFFHLTENVVSVDDPWKYITYYLVVLIFIGLAIFAGRRAGCHSICWMAPFMIIGRWLRNRFGWTSLRLVANAEACSDCKLCSKNCPMSLDVNAMVQIEQMEDLECILCGTCVDNCSKSAIRYAFYPGK